MQHPFAKSGMYSKAGGFSVEMFQQLLHKD